MITVDEIERAIINKRLTAPRITPDHVDETIVSEEYHLFENTQLTVCMLVLKNGFTVTGESACASPENFDKELGQMIARKQAVQKVWMLEGYLLKDKLYKNTLRV